MVFGVMNKDVASVGAGALAAAGGFHAVVGRVKAVLPIGKQLDQADTVLQEVIGFAQGPAGKVVEQIAEQVIQPGPTQAAAAAGP